MKGAALTADAMKTLDESMDESEQEQSGCGNPTLRVRGAAPSPGGCLPGLRECFWRHRVLAAAFCTDRVRFGSFANFPQTRRPALWRASCPACRPWTPSTASRR